MATAEQDFTKWNLPHANKGNQKPSPLGHAGNNDIVLHWRELVYRSYEAYMANRSDALKRALDICIRKLGVARGLFFSHVIQKECQAAEAARKGDDHELLTWDPTLAETSVSHMIHSSGRRADGAPTQATLGQPLHYVLRDPEQSRGVNLLDLYSKASARGTTRQAVWRVWDAVRDFMLKGCGVILAEETSGATRGYAVAQMRALRDALEAVRDFGPEEGEGTGARALGVEYRPLEGGQELVFQRGDLAVRFRATLGTVQAEDLDGMMYPAHIKHILSRLYAFARETHAGLFASVTVQRGEHDRSEHYLLLSEYVKSKIKAVLSRGFAGDWDERPSDGLTRCTVEVKALNPAFIRMEGPGEASRAWDVSSPLSEGMAMAAVVRAIADAFGLHGDARATAALDAMDQWFVRAINMAPFMPMDVPDREAQPAFVHFFSGDNLMFVTIEFNTRLASARALLGLDEEECRGRNYVVVLTARYPSVFTNVEKFMARMRFRFFMDNGGRPGVWRLWKTGRWFLPTDAESAFEPLDYQEPEQGAPPDFTTQREDLHRRPTQPNWRILSLPYHATFQALARRRARRGANARDLRYYVNSLDPDPAVVYVTRPESEAAWDALQLFRLNAMRMTSQVAVRQFGGQSFWDFRIEYSLDARDGEPVPPHPFKAYLERQAEGVREYWRRAWHEKYDDMRDWERVRQRRAPERGGPPGGEGEREAQPQPRADSPPGGAPGPRRDWADWESEEDEPVTETRLRQARRAMREAARRQLNERCLLRLVHGACA